MAKVNHQIAASWVFGSVFVLFILGLFALGPPELPLYKQQILAYISALLAGLFGIFLTGSLLVDAQLPLPGKWVVQGGSGFGLFLIVLFWWQTSAAPIPAALETPIGIVSGPLPSDPCEAATVLAKRGHACVEQGQSKEAREEFNQALGQAVKCGSKQLQADILVALAYVEKSVPNAVAAEDNVKKATELLARVEKEKGQSNELLSALASIADVRGELASNRGDLAEARKQWTESQALFEKAGRTVMVTEVKSQLSKLPAPIVGPKEPIAFVARSLPSGVQGSFDGTVVGESGALSVNLKSVEFSFPTASRDGGGRRVVYYWCGIASRDNSTYNFIAKSEKQTVDKALPVGGKLQMPSVVLKLPLGSTETLVGKVLVFEMAVTNVEGANPGFNYSEAPADLF